MYIIFGEKNYDYKGDKMKEKVKNFIEQDGLYVFTALCLLVMTLLIATVTFDGENYNIHIPFKSVFGNVAYIGIILVGGTASILLRNIDRKNIPLHKVYLAVVIPLGILYCLANPLGKVTDEDNHARKAISIADGNFFAHADKKGDAFHKFNAKLDPLVNRLIDTYAESYDKIMIPDTDEEISLVYTTMALYNPLCHMPQAAGIALARLIGGDIVWQCYFGRIMNFAVAVFFVYQAIKVMPFKKHLIMFLGLLPATLTSFASMSSDAFTIGICLYWTAYIMNLKFNDDKKEINKKDIAILMSVSIGIALCKIVYLPLCLLLFLIPKEKFGSLKKKNIIVIVTFAISVILNIVWLAYCSRFLVEFNYGVNSAEQVKFILTHPFSYILILVRTMNVYNQILILGICGESLGHYNVQASVMYIYPCIALFFMLFVANDEKVKIDWKTKLICLFVFVTTVLLIYTSVYVQWNPVNKPIINGVQARYFIPILLLTALVYNNDKIVMNGSVSKRYILLFMIFFSLNVLACTAYTYIYGDVIDFYIK